MILNYYRGFRGYNFQAKKKKTKLLIEYENVTQEVLLSIEIKLQIAKQLQYAAFILLFPVRKL
jgi:hypothetical protein